MSRSVRSALLVAAAVLGLAACAVDRAQYERAMYACNARESAADQSCGAGWMCLAGSQIGTADFCAPVCGAGGDGDYYCTNGDADGGGGAQLALCDVGAGGCDPGFSCVRTNATVDRGLCLPAETCDAERPCRDPVRETCMSDAITRHYPGGPTLSTNDMTCLQSGCDLYNACEPGHTCLSGAIPDFPAPELCVPNCDRAQRCPRAYHCASRVFRDDAYDFCLLGLVGFPCQTDDHCLVGTCADVGGGTRACAVPCASDADCAPFSTSGSRSGKVSSMHFVCGAGQCVTDTSVFMRMVCDPAVPRMCAEAAGYQCLAAAAPDGGVDGGLAAAVPICTRPCTKAADCDPHDPRFPKLACLFGAGAGYCAPGYAGLLCDESDQCLRGLECLDMGVVLGQRCTTRCSGDGDCQGVPWTTAKPTHCRSGVCSYL